MATEDYSGIPDHLIEPAFAAIVNASEIAALKELESFDEKRQLLCDGLVDFTIAAQEANGDITVNIQSISEIGDAFRSLAVQLYKGDRDTATDMLVQLWSADDTERATLMVHLLDKEKDQEHAECFQPLEKVTIQDMIEDAMFGSDTLAEALDTIRGLYEGCLVVDIDNFTGHLVEKYAEDIAVRAAALQDAHETRKMVTEHMVDVVKYLSA